MGLFSRTVVTYGTRSVSATSSGIESKIVLCGVVWGNDVCELASGEIKVKAEAFYY